ncbi:universal stress protein [Pseudomonas sp. LS44]|uniref:universal stress protein n=1 Tax=Pseudomonas sp. LS44 TaxID=1357074 RepID=UPI00215A3FAA|nr:universal stress protein [Pseudomonas sp. LS44]UVE18291.1 universal stress protein [Pseudomonas sp. LS44]
MFRHILIAHDLSREADVALQRAALLARQHSARLTLLHVLDHPDLRHVTEGQLGRLLNACAVADSQLVLLSGVPHDVIARQLKTLAVDLLVLGAHHKGRPELFAGTTLERVARQSQVPVLLAVHEPVEPYRQALVALDFSLSACTALQLGQHLLPSEAGLYALHICEVAPVRAAKAQEELDCQRTLFDQLVADERAKLPAGRQLQHGVRQGERQSCLEAAIEEWRPQLLALGQHNRSMLSEALLGGLTQHLLRQPPCDVLISRGA